MNERGKPGGPCSGFGDCGCDECFPPDVALVPLTQPAKSANQVVDELAEENARLKERLADAEKALEKIARADVGDWIQADLKRELDRMKWIARAALSVGEQED